MTVHKRESPGSLAAWDRRTLLREGAGLLNGVSRSRDLRAARNRLLANVATTFTSLSRRQTATHDLIRARDFASALTNILRTRSDERARFSVAAALWDLAAGRPRPDLREGFYAELIHLVRGLECRASFGFLVDAYVPRGRLGREAALARSDHLDKLWAVADRWMSRYANGLNKNARDRRLKRQRHVLASLEGTASDWNNWRWHVRHLIRDEETLGRLTPLRREERDNIARARSAGLPFAITPYYASLMDSKGLADRAIRAQVIPPADYIAAMADRRAGRQGPCDFMQEADTSPIDLVTRRYPAIAILKPFNACPQICVYCQRNWQIQQAMAPDALASEQKIDAAIRWIKDHPALREILITGGDPLALPDRQLHRIMSRLAEIDSLDVIRIGTRTPVTIPMRITPALAKMLGSFREIGRRNVAIVTHVEHPYEITPDMAAAVDRLRRAGLTVYNQQVFTFYVSRRFESALLRMLLCRIGISPYYTFVPQGKEETASYRVPVARILQERKEEAQLLPGLRRTDEPVYNVPGLGKNYVRATQHHNILSILPNGARVYEFHPWEKNVAPCHSYVMQDVPILDYLTRLAQIGEDPADYDSIWYYF